MTYISFAFTILFFIGLSLINYYFSKPHRGEDGMALGMLLQIVCLGFIICSLILVISIAWKGGFDWVSSVSRTRYLLIGIGWICMVVIIFDSTIFESGWYKDFPEFYRSLLKRIGQLWMPLLTLVSCFFLLNADFKSRVSPYFYKAPMSIAFGLAVLMVLGIFFGYVRKKIEYRKAVKEARQEEDRKYGANRSWHFKTSIDYIHLHKDTTIKRLLSYAIKKNDGDQTENAEIRTAAIAKIKSFDHWETDLIIILEQKDIRDIYDAFGFIADNKVEHPENFIIPINRSIAYVTAVAQESIKSPDNVYLWSTNISALCQILETQFKNSAAEFRPNMLRLQQVLNLTPVKRSDNENAEGFNEILEKSRHAVKNWLEQN